MDLGQPPAEKADVIVQNGLLHVGVRAPYAGKQGGSCQRLTLAFHKQFNHKAQLFGDRDLLPATGQQQRLGVVHQIPVPQHHQLLDGGLPPQVGPDTGQQLPAVKGFTQIVVGAGIQAGHLVFHGGQRRQHHHRRHDSLAAAFPQDVRPAFAGEHPVHQRQVVGVLLQIVSAFLPVGAGFHRVALFFKDFAQHPVQFPVIFDH